MPLESNKETFESNLPLMNISLTVSPLSGLSISTCIDGLKYSNLSFVVYVFGGASIGSVIKHLIPLKYN